MFGRCPKFIRTLCPKPQIYLNFIELIQEKQRFAQVSAAANRAASRPGQAFTLSKNKCAIETAGRRQVQAPGTFLQAFLQMPQMTGDLSFGEADPLRQVAGGYGVGTKRLQDHVTGSLKPFRRG